MNDKGEVVDSSKVQGGSGQKVKGLNNWEGEITPREGQRVKWVQAMRLADFPMPPADLPLLPYLRDLLG